MRHGPGHLLGQPATRKPRLRRLLLGLGIVTGALWVVAWLGFMAWLLILPPVSPAKTRQVTPGMAAAQVRALLGGPGAVHTREDGGEEWVYSKTLQWNMFYVQFSPDGRVEQAWWDDEPGW